MIFSSFQFLFFLLAIMALLIIVPGQRARKIVLLVASYYFYAFWDYRFLALLIFSTVANAYLGKAMYTATDQNSMTTTPDVVGKTGTFAEQMLKAANLNVQFAGDSSGKVVAQDVEAGTSAAYGTIITLTMDSGEDTTHDAPTVTEEIDPANEEG